GWRTARQGSLIGIRQPGRHNQGLGVRPGRPTVERRANARHSPVSPPTTQTPVGSAGDTTFSGDAARGSWTNTRPLTQAPSLVSSFEPAAVASGAFPASS